MDPSRRAKVRRVTMFGAVSIATTAVDFGIFNALIGWHLAPLLAANTIGYAGGVLASYLLNKHLTFKGGGRDKVHQEIALFLLVNLAALWLSNITVVLAARLFSHSILILNGAKFVAGAGSWVLKYLIFKRWVYPQTALEEAAPL